MLDKPFYWMIDDDKNLFIFSLYQVCSVEDIQPDRVTVVLSDGREIVLNGKGIRNTFLDTLARLGTMMGDVPMSDVMAEYDNRQAEYRSKKEAE